MKSWTEFLKDSPERVVTVIEEGPSPLAEYATDKLRWSDKKRGMMRFKGDGQHKPKRGYAAVIYFDPSFCVDEYKIDEVPDEVKERHSLSKTAEAFEQL